MFKFGITAPAGRFGVDSTIEGIERAGQVGVEGIEFFGLENVDVDALAKASAAHDVDVFGSLAMGAGSEIGDSEAPCMVRPEYYDQAVEDIERSIEKVARFDGSTLIVTVGQSQKDLEAYEQQNAIVRVLRAVAPLAETHDVTVVPEPLNVRRDHPGYFLTTTGQGVEIIEAVDSPNVKLLYDIYHQQITEGDVITRFEENVEHIGHVHLADNPGRHEPGTGELNYERIFEAIAEADYERYVSCEFSCKGDPMSVFEDLVEMADEARS